MNRSVLYACFISNKTYEYLNLQPEINPSGNSDQAVSSCDQTTVYEGQVCLSELTRWQQCFTPQSNAKVYVPTDIDQQGAEDTANTLLRNLPFLSPSTECLSAIRPFLCLYLFGSCDSNNQSHQVTQTDCATLRDDVCVREWALAEGIVDLPICDELFKEEEECQGIYAPFLFYSHYSIWHM